MATLSTDSVTFPNRRITCRSPQWTYLKLQLITNPPTPPSNQEPLDPLTARTYLTAAFSQFLGLLGTAIALDIISMEMQGLWIRVPRDDAAGVVAALSSWIGLTTTTAAAAGGSSAGEGGPVERSVAWRVLAKGNFLGAIVHGSGGDVFNE